MSEEIYNNFLGQYSIKLSPRFLIEQYILDHGSWEQHVLECFKYFIKPGAVCVDVGANAGFHTIAMAHYAGATGKVYAFEPNSLTYPRLIDNLNINPQLNNRVVCEKRGLSDRNETLRLFQVGNADGNAYVGREFNEKLWNSGGPDDFDLCIALPLDDYLAGQRVDFIKVDVEGMELEVLSGARATLTQWSPVLVYETIMEYFDHQKILKTEQLLRELGYHLFGLDPSIQKLVPAGYPDYCLDTVAVHSSKLLEIADILAPAARLRVGDAGGGLAKSIDLVVLAPGQNQIFVGVCSASGTTLAPIPAVISDGNLTFSCMLERETTLFSLNFTNTNQVPLSGFIENASGKSAVLATPLDGSTNLPRG